MNLLPYDKFCITTSLKPAEVQNHLQAEVSPEQRWGLIKFQNPANTYFTGVAANGNFKFMRVITNRNSFLPVITGHTESWINGSRVFVKMRPQLFVAAFMCIWLGGVGVAGIVMLTKGVINNKFSPILFLPFGMFAFGYAMLKGFYSYERNKARDILLYLLNGQIDETVSYLENKP